MLAGETWINF